MTCVFMFVCVCVRECVPVVFSRVCVGAIVRFIVNSRGSRGRFHLSVLIIGVSVLVNCLCPGNRLSSTLKTHCMVSVVGL